MAARKKPATDEAAAPEVEAAEPVGAPGSPPVEQNSVQAVDAATADGGISEAALEAGFIGDKRDPNPNEAYSLESGPDSPLASEPS